MKRIILILFIASSSLAAICQSKTAFVIFFKDKETSSYSLSNPTAFLSAKSVDRRTQYTIPIDSSDLPVNNQYIAQILSDPSLKEITRSRWFNWLVVWGETDDDIYLKSLPFVKKVDVLENQYSAGAKTIFEKPFFKNELLISSPKQSKSVAKITNLFDEGYYGNAWNQTQMLKVHKLHEKGYQGQGMTIAVLDAGFYKVDVVSGFDSIRNNGQIKGTRNFVHPTESVYGTSFQAIHTHGTNVLSTIATNLPGQMVGTAPKADFWLLRSEDGEHEYILEEYFWTAAAEFADSVGADIINSSLGYTEFESPLYNHTYQDLDGNTAVITNTADKAASKGILVVNSAGNEGNDAWRFIGTPADADSVLAVGAVDPSGILSSFSSRGPTADGRIKPDVSAQGAPAAVFTSYGSVSYGSGTSFSSPIIAGAVACLWQANRMANNMEIIKILKESTNFALNPNNSYGWGIPNCEVALQKLSTKPFNPHNLKIYAYPNPFHESLVLEFPFVTGEVKIDIQIHTISGSCVFSQAAEIESSYNQVPLENLQGMAQGIYVVSVKSADWSVQTKVVKY